MYYFKTKFNYYFWQNLPEGVEELFPENTMRERKIIKGEIEKRIFVFQQYHRQKATIHDFITEEVYVVTETKDCKEELHENVYNTFCMFDDMQPITMGKIIVTK